MAIGVIVLEHYCDCVFGNLWHEPPCIFPGLTATRAFLATTRKTRGFSFTARRWANEKQICQITQEPRLGTRQLKTVRPSSGRQVGIGSRNGQRRIITDPPPFFALLQL